MFRAPWSLRGYALLLVASAIGVAIALGGGSNWTRVVWAAIFGVGACEGNRWFWWFLVLGNIASVIAAPFIVGTAAAWLPITIGLVALALLLLPDSRRYVFGSTA